MVYEEDFGVEVKPVIQSKTVWGNAASIAAFVAVLISAKTHIPAEIIEPIIAPVVVGIGANIVSIFGRLFAKKKLVGVISTK